MTMEIFIWLIIAIVIVFLACWLFPVVTGNIIAYLLIPILYLWAAVAFIMHRIAHKLYKYKTVWVMACVISYLIIAFFTASIMHAVLNKIGVVTQFEFL